MSSKGDTRKGMLLGAYFAKRIPYQAMTGWIFLTRDARRIYSATGTFPRLTLSPSRGRSDQNDSDDRIVNAPSVRKA
jgi:hypothetical protein